MREDEFSEPPFEKCPAIIYRCMHSQPPDVRQPVHSKIKKLNAFEKWYFPKRDFNEPGI